VSVYVETGIFIDYLSCRGSARSLRTESRRGRSQGQLALDAEAFLLHIRGSRNGGTSALTCYEAEEALFKDLATTVKGVSRGGQLIVPVARALMMQTLTAIQYFDVQVLELSPGVIERQLSMVELQKRGLRAADALHVATAVEFDADLLVSGDEDILNVDGVITNRSGRVIRCVDSHDALKLLGQDE